jgi:hypothetical protein
VSHLLLDWQRPGVWRFWEGVAESYTLIRFVRSQREPASAETAAVPGATFIPLQGNSHFPWHGDVELLKAKG